MISETHLEDCMIGMARFPDRFFDLAVVDPPYGNIDAIGLTDNLKGKQAAKRKQYKQFDNIAPEDAYYYELCRISKHQIIWGGNFLGLTGGGIVWNKNGTAFGEGEFAICSTHKSIRFFEYTWNGMIQGDMKNKEQRIHPTQKPIALYAWIYDKYLSQGGKVIDTHLGSQSNRIAAYDRGNIDFYGWEIDEDYFNDGNTRFEAHRTKKEEIKTLGFARTELQKINPTLF